MNGLFSIDSKFYQVISRISDLVVLNVLYLISCIPIVTIGAASTALYTVCFRFGTEREKGLWTSYWRAFRDDFKKSTELWLLAMIGIAASSVAVAWYVRGGILHYMSFPMGVAAVVIFLIAGMAFPLNSQFENTVSGTMKNALLLCLCQLPKAIVVCLLHFLPAIVFLFRTDLFIRLWFLWVFLYDAGIAGITVKLFKKTYQKIEKNGHSNAVEI